MKPIDIEQNGPRNKERWERVQQNLKRYQRVHANVPFLLVLEYWSGVRAYYGSSRRALSALARYEFWKWWHHVIGRIHLIITDGVGWTKVYFYPETDTMPAYHLRHGWKCSGSPNCDDLDCISRSIPRWFKRLTRWED